MIALKFIGVALGTGVLLVVFAEDIGQELFLAIVACLS
jgi:hypothetical protein